MLNKLKAPFFAVLGAILIVSAVLIFKIQNLSANLKTNTNITQNLKHELDQMVKEEEEYKKKFKDSQAEVENLNTALKSLKEEKVRFRSGQHPMWAYRNTKWSYCWETR